jgi:hypothetical protein
MRLSLVIALCGPRLRSSRKGGLCAALCSDRRQSVIPAGSGLPVGNGERATDSHAGTELKRLVGVGGADGSPSSLTPRDPSDNPATKRGFSLAITVALRGHACAVSVSGRTQVRARQESRLGSRIGDGTPPKPLARLGRGVCDTLPVFGHRRRSPE